MPFLPIHLSNGFSSSVSSGDSVTIGQVIAKRVIPQESKIDLSAELDVSPHAVHYYVKKNPGDFFTPGEVLAIKKNFWGGNSAKVVSKSSGVVTHIERNTGEMFILPQSTQAKEPDNNDIVSPIEGTIALCNNDKILIETDKNVIQAQRGFGPQTTQEIMILEEHDTVESYHINAQSIGKIVVGSYFPKDVLAKSISIGISAVIGTKILDTDIEYLSGRNMQIPIVEITNEDKKEMKSWHGRRAFVNGEGKTIILLH